MAGKTYQSDRRAALKAKGLCSACAKNPTESERTKCTACARKAKAYASDRYHTLRMRGICLVSKCPNTTGGHVHCRDHERMTRERVRRAA